ncbi:MAG: hypothetical protein A2271_03700 [Candidatus Moranbacteria bacterium RIFOXYA12_FULL_35_19]|nr:MAG: hypothetical protein UR78_C0003G0012 [Candidatus Moranbacteria bacterium GW2011_GWF2_35_39]OGI31848.1 MAG: hypothetical protein A2343_01370 [Candidatus Moranbacteria bacterium RIFOXYB12_FULL_35_8]OGI33370.1 MAG: hypothetical protein A2489_03915 [Candidatus Moranbacteria bacterium RIFOXYC12_FULL_36_13]OGI36280.1 MAG: hypothetical protein A2271_03700 [Candidatus Moranbacteria bacterium RIFOXYA12_FULL_35_19]
MASQIAHIVYAKKYFDRLDSEGLNDLEDEKTLLVPTSKINRDEFILGCVFPDIRRIDKNIKRKDTHLYFPVLDLNFSGLTSFEAGWKFHLYCDMKREEILNKYSFYSLNEVGYTRGLAAKLLEDELVYEEYNNWEKIVSYFNHAPFAKVNTDILPETFNLWYAIVAKYIEVKPNDKTIKIFLSKQKISNKLEEIIKLIQELREDEKAVQILKKVKDEII